MASFESSQAVFKSGAAQLSRIINFDEATPDAWTERDLPAMLRHQLAAPLEFDLSTLELSKSERAARAQTLKGAAAAQIRTFQDLLGHPRPPLALLNWAKDFFKQQAGASAKRRPEQEVAYLLYLLSILMARVRLGTNITKLSDAGLLKALKWATSRRWLDATTREMCLLARKTLRARATG